MVCPSLSERYGTIEMTAMIIIIDYMSPHSDLDNNNLFCSQDTLSHDDAPSYQVWLHKRLTSSEDVLQTKPGARTDRHAHTESTHKGVN